MLNPNLFQSFFNADTVFGILSYRTDYADAGETLVSAQNGWNVQVSSAGEKTRISCAHEGLGLGFNFYLTYLPDGVDVFLPKTEMTEGKNRFFSMIFFPDLFQACEGDDGAFILPQQSGVLSRFRNKNDSVHRIGIYGNGISECTMPIFGMTDERTLLSCIMGSGYFDGTMVLETARGMEKIYCLSLEISFRYEFNVRRQNAPMVSDDLLFHFRTRTLNSRSAVSVLAEDYRNFLLKSKRITPLAERMADYPELAYAAEAPEIRVRMGVKWPFPSEVPEQTPENEPEVHVFCSFDDVKKMVDECERQGLRKACFCLVGWANKGHDGRYPQILPVEPALGGEAKLRELIAYVQAKGYRIAAHDNHYDAYRISEDPFDDLLIRTQDGGALKDGIWGGGQAYLLCPEAMYRKYSVRNLEAIRDLGFKGIHFTDCLSTTGLKVCWDPAHPHTKKEMAEWRVRILRKGKELFGGVQCEGPFDFAAGVLDRVLYIESPLAGLMSRPYVDESVPLYEMVFHGILLYNVTGESINALPGSALYLRNLAFGGMPYFYFYRHFATKNYLPGTNTPVQGKFATSDYTLDRLPEEVAGMKHSVNELIGTLGHLQRCFMTEFVRYSEYVTRTDYSNEESVFVNTGDSEWSENGIHLSPKSFLLVGRQSERV